MLLELDATKERALTAACRYNRVNGTHMSENAPIIRDILRKEWGSSATIMSDWCVAIALHMGFSSRSGEYRLGVYSIDHAINAGLDLEMPGTNKWRTLDLVNRS